MAIASVGTGGTDVNTGNNQSTSTHDVATNNLSAGRLGVLIIAVDNNQTTDGDENAVSGMTDDAGNTWTKGIEFTNGQGSAQAGATVSIWWCLATNNLNAGAGIDWNFSNNASRDESASSLWIFSVGAGSTIAVEGTPSGLAGDGADAASHDVTTGNIECLRVRGIAAELNSATQMTATSGSWTLFGNARSANVATAMAVYGEWNISTATGAASDPTLPATCDHASAYIAFREVAPTGKPTHAHQYRLRRAA